MRKGNRKEAVALHNFCPSGIRVHRAYTVTAAQDLHQRILVLDLAAFRWHNSVESNLSAIFLEWPALCPILWEAHCQPLDLLGIWFLDNLPTARTCLVVFHHIYTLLSTQSCLAAIYCQSYGQPAVYWLHVAGHILWQLLISTLGDAELQCYPVSSPGAQLTSQDSITFITHDAASPCSFAMLSSANVLGVEPLFSRMRNRNSSAIPGLCGCRQSQVLWFSFRLPLKLHQLLWAPCWHLQ